MLESRSSSAASVLLLSSAHVRFAGLYGVWCRLLWLSNLTATSRLWHCGICTLFQWNMLYRAGFAGKPVAC